MITKGVKTEAELAINYVLKEYYLPLSKTGTDSINAFCQTVNFDLIDYLQIVWNYGSNSANSNGEVEIWIDSQLNTEETSLSDDDHGVFFIDCSSITGEKELLVLGKCNDSGKTVYLHTMSIVYNERNYTYAPLA